MSRSPVKPGQLELINQRGREPVQPPKLLGHIRKTTLGHSEQLLAHLFSASDDLFYDLSKRASSNHEQNLYFEAMRELRIKREGIANKFLSSLNTNFSDLIDIHSNGGFESLPEEEDPSHLSIVEGDDLEIDLARSNMVSRTRHLFREELYELATRLDHLLLQIEIDEDNNPLDPNQLSKAFIYACHDALEVNIKARLILFKLFEKHVLTQLGHIFADANQILMDAGILPKVPKNLDERVVHGGGDGRNTAGANPDQPASQSEGEPAATQGSFVRQAYGGPATEFKIGHDALNLIMAAARGAAFKIKAPVAPAQPSGGAPHPGFFTTTLSNGANCYIFSSNPGPLMAAQELTGLLSQNQPSYDQQLTEENRPQNIISAVVGKLLGQKNPSKPQSLAQNDENIINLVAMFFDQILADEALPIEVQTLLCRLQIPILKLALRDQSFFNNPLHPARKLINRITEIGLSFDASKPLTRDPLFRKIADIVQTINRQYKADDTLFAELQAQLDELVERESKKSSIVEKRTTQTESGKSRIKHARSAAQTSLYEKMKNANLPEVVREFLTAQWLQVMVITYLKNGGESTEWVANEQTVSDIIWMCQEHTDPRSAQRRERLMPELLDRVEKDLESAIDNQDLRKSKVDALESALRALPQEVEIQDTVAPLNEEQKEALGKGQDAPKSWEEMSAIERQQARYEELSAHFFEMAKNMPEGTWLNYFNEDSGRQVRCKLSSKIDADTYIFVNRLGFKSLEKSRKQFAYDMQFGRAAPIDNRPFFDRVMNRVVEDLQEQEQEA